MLWAKGRGEKGAIVRDGWQRDAMRGKAIGVRAKSATCSGGGQPRACPAVVYHILLLCLRDA